MKRILLISILHFILTAGCAVGATYAVAEAIRAGAERTGIFGSVLDLLASILTQPAASTLFHSIPKDSEMLWPILVLNSILWALIISGLWSKMALIKNNANT
jgi:hypothetical protein